MSQAIMIVEDEGIVALELKECLEQLGYSVPTVASTGLDAVSKAGELTPDLVLMDIRLKGSMDGIEAGSRIMESMGIPVVYLTAYSDDLTVRRAKESAPFGYILKPWEEKTLNIAIEMALRKARQDAEVKDERDWYHAVLHYMGAPMIVCDLEGRATFANAAAERLLGKRISPEETRSLHDILRFRDRDAEQAPTLAVTQDLARNGVMRSRDFMMVTPSGDEMPVDIMFTPILSARSEVTGFSVLMRPEGTSGAVTSQDEETMVLEDEDEDAALKDDLVREAIRNARDQIRSIWMERPNPPQGQSIEPDRLETYLRAVVERVAEGFDHDGKSLSTTVSAGGIQLDLNSAIYCSLVVNEFLGNLLQNPAFGAPPRSVTIGLSPAEDDRVRLQIDFDSSGTTLHASGEAILDALVSELGGSLCLESESHSRWTVVFRPDEVS